MQPAPNQAQMNFRSGSTIEFHIAGGGAGGRRLPDGDGGVAIWVSGPAFSADGDFVPRLPAHPPRADAPTDP